MVNKVIKETETSQSQKTQKTQQTQQIQQSQQITVSELIKRAITCIELATSRGAYKANELVYVGSTFNNLNKYYESLKAQEKATEQQQITSSLV